MRLAFWRRRKDHREEIIEELDRDIKGRPGIYIDGTEIPDRRRIPRPPPKSPGLRAEEPIEDPFAIPFVPRPPDGPADGDSQ